MILLLQYTLIFASVLMLVALGGCFAERSGVINIGLEGIMVIGALGGALVMKFLPVSVGAFAMVSLTVLASVLFGMIFSLLLAVAAIQFKADQTITGTAMNMLATAGATVAVKAMNTAASGGNDVSSDIVYTQAKDLFVVRLGNFEFNWFMVLALVCLLVSYVALYKTRFGLRLRACGGIIDGFQIAGPLPAGQPVVDPHLGRRGVDDLKGVYAGHQPDVIEILRQLRVIVRAAGLVFRLHPAQVGAAFENRHARNQPGGRGHALHIPAVDAGNSIGAVIDPFSELAVGVHKRPGAVDPFGVAGAGGDVGPAQHGTKDLDQFGNGNHVGSHPA